ncbi:MAG: YicC/YloC family endoribonuclease [Eubacterium sp.]
MIKSMTGFGHAECSDEKRNVTVDIRTVNHRYCDFFVHMPRAYSFAEEAVKSAVRETVKRGKVDITITVDTVCDEDIKLELNKALATQYYEKLTELSHAFDVMGNISLEYLASQPDVIKTAQARPDEEELTEAILAPVREAAAKLDEMRITEGRKLEKDLLEKRETILGYLAEIEKRAPEVPAVYAEKLKNRINDLLGSSSEVSDERIAQEAAIFADRCCVDEEITRLHSHLDQFKSIIAERGPNGKRLDFLVQEMNREANTIGSKANDLAITEQVLKIKAEVEKIREQVQNIE